MPRKVSKDKLNRFADEIATLMLKSLEQFPRAEQERRLEAIRKIGRRIGRKTSRKFSRDVPTKAERQAIRRGEAAYRKGDAVTLAEYFAGKQRSPRVSGSKTMHSSVANRGAHR